MSDTLLETGHLAAVTDIAADANGRHLATASHDGTVRIYDSVMTSKEPSQYKGGPQPATWTHTTTLQCCGEEQAAAVLCVAWAPLVFYSAALVTCTEGINEVALWSDVGNDGHYRKVYSYALAAPGWCVAWAPHEYGKLFAVGCADGAVVVFTGGPDGTWDIHAFESHPHGCSGVSFAPFFPPGALLMAPLEQDLGGGGPGSVPPVPFTPPRLVTCGGGRTVKVWTHSFAAPPSGEPTGAPPESLWTAVELEASEAATTPAWREVSWAPNLGLPYTYIAAGAEDGLAAVWVQDGPLSNPWQCRLLAPPHGTPGENVTKLSWSLVGTFLLVSYADGTVAMWKETSNNGEWRVVSELENPML